MNFAEKTIYVAPRTPLEAKLAELWSTSIGVQPIGIHDDFLHLGGDSLAATRIMSRISHHFGVKLTLQAFFAAPTIAELALTILQAKLAENRSTAVTDKE
ncbi:MAG: phosphopantetheine-binding protein [Caldilineaceae bacterium]